MTKTLPAPLAIRLTKADTIALWRAVDDMKSMLVGMKMDPPCTPDQIAEQEARVLAAKRALRKVYAVRKSQASPRTAGRCTKEPVAAIGMPSPKRPASTGHEVRADD